MAVPFAKVFAARRVLITGGAGFIGSNLARRLVRLGAMVTLVDSMIPEYGGNLRNLSGYGHMNSSPLHKKSHPSCGEMPVYGKPVAASSE